LYYLGISVLPFSSVLELLNDRWIFGKSFCSAWLALDVLCCTASIIALMAVSIDRYIGVTRPLNYGSIMTTRRTIYLIIIVWGVSILTSVVPLFGLTDRGKISTDTELADEQRDTCIVNKNTFYTIFSSMISFYIPVVILLILYSRVYQEAKKQGKKLENEKRRLYEIDYQIKSKQVEQQQSSSSEHPKKNRILSSNRSDEHKNEVTKTLINHDNILNEECNGTHSNKDDSGHKVNKNRRFFFIIFSSFRIILMMIHRILDH
jgi:adrenergic receptor beta-2